MAHLLPVEWYLFLILIIPLGVCFLKWARSLDWPVAALICAASSWVYLNLMMKFAPPNNGFAIAVYFVSGWLWLLPFFGVYFLIFNFLLGWISAERQKILGRGGFRLCATLTLAILAWNLFGRMSEERAVIEARQQLEERGYQPHGQENPVYEDGHWFVRYPETDFKEIKLTRNGQMAWITGPG